MELRRHGLGWESYGTGPRVSGRDSVGPTGVPWTFGHTPRVDGVGLLRRTRVHLRKDWMDVEETKDPPAHIVVHRRFGRSVTGGVVPPLGTGVRVGRSGRRT